MSVRTRAKDLWQCAEAFACLSPLSVPKPRLPAELLVLCTICQKERRSCTFQWSIDGLHLSPDEATIHWRPKRECPTACDTTSYISTKDWYDGNHLVLNRCPPWTFRELFEPRFTAFPFSSTRRFKPLQIGTTFHFMKRVTAFCSKDWFRHYFWSHSNSHLLKKTSLFTLITLLSCMKQLHKPWARDCCDLCVLRALFCSLLAPAVTGAQIAHSLKGCFWKAWSAARVLWKSISARVDSRLIRD